LLQQERWLWDKITKVGVEMELFKGWIINICTALFFITAVEMILPDNNMKKYVKFVLGLILMTVILNPLVKFLNHGVSISTYITASSNSIEKHFQEDNTRNYREENINETLKVFKQNLEKLCEDKLKERFSKGTYKVNADVYYNIDDEQFYISAINVGFTDSRIQKVQKIVIKTNTNNEEKSNNQSQTSVDIKIYLSNELKLSKDIIQVYDLGT
jgi:stage III sporulation protein AF